MTLKKITWVGEGGLECGLFSSDEMPVCEWSMQSEPKEFFGRNITCLLKQFVLTVCVYIKYQLI